MKKEKSNKIEEIAKTSAPSCWMMGIFFLGLKRKAHHPRGATFAYKNNSENVGAGLVSAQENQNKFQNNKLNTMQNRVGAILIARKDQNALYTNKSHVRVACHATRGPHTMMPLHRGITLISMVITIIILLILAGVAINLTIGNEGIFKLAEDASQKYENSAQKEQYDLAQVNNYISNSRNPGYTITKLGEQTGTNPISIDVTKYDSIYVEICQERAYMSNTIPVAVLKEQYKYYLGSATWAGAGMWYGFQISKTNVKINEVRRDNVDVTSSATITVYGINY